MLHFSSMNFFASVLGNRSRNDGRVVESLADSGSESESDSDSDMDADMQQEQMESVTLALETAANFTAPLTTRKYGYVLNQFCAKLQQWGYNDCLNLPLDESKVKNRNRLKQVQCVLKK